MARADRGEEQARRWRLRWRTSAPARRFPILNFLFAPVKRHATDLIVEKATELGVRRIRPVITQRTIAETVRLDRLERIAREAAEQTERFDAPEICAPVSLAKALDGWDAARALIFCDEAGMRRRCWRRRTSLSLAEKWRAERVGWGRADTPAPARCAPLTPNRLPARARGSALVLIGPEGGFTTEERAMLRRLRFVIPVSLGPRILRAETAVDRRVNHRPGGLGRLALA